MASDERTTLLFTRCLPRRCRLIWEIHGFSGLNLKTGEKLVSDKFYHSEEKHRRFSLFCYPKGVSDVADEHISLFLNMDSSQENLLIDATIYFTDKENQIVNPKEIEGHNLSKSSWGYSNYFPINRLNEVLSEKDTLTVNCSVTSYSIINTSNRILKRNNFDCARYEALSGDLEKLIADEAFSDVVIELRESEFRACRNILSHRSPVLGDSTTIEISDMEENAFEIFLQYLYTANFPELSLDVAATLLRVSETYRVPSLKLSCFDYLKDMISADTVCDILTLACEYDGSELKAACTDFVTKNSFQMCFRKGWKNKLSSHPKVIVRLIESVRKVHPPVEVKLCRTRSRPQLTATEYTAKWTIIDFSKCQLDPQDRLESPIGFFSETDDCGLLYLYPKGRKRDDGDYLSLSVFTTLEKDAYFTLGIINDENKLEHVSTVSSNPYHCDRFIKRSELFLNKHLLINDCLTIYFKTYLFSERATTRKPNIVPLASHVSLSEDLGKLYESKYLADVTLKLGESEFEAHRNILSARSSVFGAMFKSDMRESESNLVEIPDLDPQHFEVLLRYLYTAKLPPLTFRLAKNLLIMSDKYDVKCLKSECTDYLNCVLSVANVSEILLLADMHGEPELREAGMDVLLDNFEFVTDWREKLSPELLAELLEEQMKIPDISDSEYSDAD